MAWKILIIVRVVNSFLAEGVGGEQVISPVESSVVSFFVSGWVLGS